MSDSPILIYGAYGYTGELCARFAAEQGLSVVLAGRDAVRLGEVASRYGQPARVFSLDETRELDEGLEGVGAVVHCAGPFSRTMGPMLEACIRTGVHYLDITGEIAVFEQVAARGSALKAAGIMALPGAGFDVVPSDCLAAHLKEAMPDANELDLGIQFGGSISHGTATTVVENLHRGGAVRRNGRIELSATGSLRRTIDFGRGPLLAMAIPWGDVSTAYHSTGIPNVTVYAAMKLPAILFVRGTSPVKRIFGTRVVQRMLHRWVDSRPAGPSDRQRERGRTYLWGEVRNAKGECLQARIETPEGYTLTALTALAAGVRAAGGDAPPGFQTPSTAYGADFVLEFDVAREDAHPPLGG
jgi:short subunit dehydrogenase-like uncharacterized protein